MVLIGFEASLHGDRVALRWETGTELGVAGFNLLRAQRLAGPYRQINADMIAARGNGTGGARYDYLDAPEPCLSEPDRTPDRGRRDRAGPGFSVPPTARSRIRL